MSDGLIKAMIVGCMAVLIVGAFVVLCVMEASCRASAFNSAVKAAIAKAERGSEQ